MANKAKAIDINTLKNITPVPFTQTWHPVHHADVMDHATMTLAGMGLEPERSHIEVSQNGMDMFATINLPAEGHRDSFSIGIRNSMQQNFALGFVGGHRVLCCSNMCFFGDFVENRRHTNGLTPEALHAFICDAILKAMAGSQDMRIFYEDLHNYRLTEDHRKVMTIEMMENDILPPSKFFDFQAAWNDELADNPFAGAESLAHFHGAATRVLRTQSIANQQYRTLDLNKLIERHVPTPGALALATPAERFDGIVRTNDFRQLTGAVRLSRSPRRERRNR